MSEVNKGDKVKVHYTGKLDDGTVFDSSENREPLEFTIGENQVIPGFENAVEGMSPGDEKTITIPAAEAYGEHNPALIQQVDRQQIPDDVPLQIGQQLQVQSQDGQPFVVTVTELEEASVTLDANHPLAGQNLTFELQLVSAE